MHGISHLLSHHGHNSDSRSSQDSKSSSGSSTSDTRQQHQDTRILQELLNQKQDGRLYFHGKQLSRGSVSSTYSYGTSSYGSSHSGSSSNPLHNSLHHHSVYHTIHGSGHHHQNNHHHYHNPALHHVHHNTSGRASPTSPSPTNDQDKQHRHHHHSIQEMIKHFGRRLGHIRRQSECQETPKRRDEDFRNRSQSLDGGARHPSLLENDCETTYRIYESIIRQGNESNWSRFLY